MNTAVAERERGLLGLAPGYWGLLMVALVGLFLIGLDQGQALSTFMGEAAYQQNLLHEIFHDVRHAAGFMCH
ncbi:MAG: CbtB-domain containing protein [Chloroflexi bacterium]|nr:CbtB-domain containing protein [Chloroflexota bacterium]